jgi:hypothetical protein
MTAVISNAMCKPEMLIYINQRKILFFSALKQ